MSRFGRMRSHDDTTEWQGAYAPYDLIKELCVAIGVMALLATLLTVLFSSPDDRPSTIAQWSRQMPADFVTTAVAELDGSSDTAGYGPPYNHNGTGQHVSFIRLQKWLGVSHPIDTANDFVISPLRSIPDDPALRGAIATYQSAPANTRAAWTAAYAKSLEQAQAGANGTVTVATGNYGPVPRMMTALLAFAQSGGLDGDLLTNRQFYQTDYTKPLLFMADGGILSSRAQAQDLLGTQWGMMNETSSYPGQVWLWLYTLWYQVEPFKSSDNADAQVMFLMTILSLGLILIPFIPGVRSLPRHVPIYRLIWREHYRAQRGA